jgi:hypothetical protein
MLSSFRTLGATVIVLVGCLGVIASSATAKSDDFEAESSPYILTGASTTNHEYRFGKASVMTCASSSLFGTISGKSLQSFTVQPTYNTCTLSGLAATVDSPCSFEFTGATDSFEHGRTHIECEGTNAIRITISGCTVVIGEQSPEQGAHYKTTGSGKTTDVDLSVTMNNATYTTVGSFCGIVGGLGNDLSIIGSYTLRAYEDKEGTEGAQIAFSAKTTI